ncbi:aromatic-ring-hydroxylating dioxygenase subunit beta [Mycolicibacterium mucogenicum]|uniref:Ring-hydroxylating dioxygenase subunit beta n=1 Tax=Mycolicibacterium mucogenicum DSM 44124 TaxID=1226753 RepID=A0A8H2PFH9_MYCMU|nr:aromatic-ring-hydroxylating dioxygenase subunit beta [Mycolicibacterium mucogenicum]KAB7761368.1 dioxygenase [Mycolicibacterium mucogenicum DSM 44124]QPG70193.1 aromatic-ring-hydroxylating dioxygenase subunit beta [Mycolicibacterium mucogenicum DSM 44124]
MTTSTGVELRELEQFIYREARFADEHDYDAWEALWTDDALYWVPAAGSLADPEHHVSVIYDNRRRISTRLQQLRTGKRYSQAPASNLRRIISNVEILSIDGDESTAGANFVLYESKSRGIETWAGRVTYVLRRVDGELKLARKTVVLVNCAEALPTLGFLI